MDQDTAQKLNEALKMLSFRRYGMVAEMLEELSESVGNECECAYWLAYAYRRMRRYREALRVLETHPSLAEELAKVKSEGRAYDLFQEAMELQGKGEYRKIKILLEEARRWSAEDPEMKAWIDEELEFYGAPLFNR